MHWVLQECTEYVPTTRECGMSCQTVVNSSWCTNDGGRRELNSQFKLCMRASVSRGSCLIHCPVLLCSRRPIPGVGWLRLCARRWP